jgi:hypothetical protein
MAATLNDIPQMKRCIYCDREKHDKEFSQEHILPRSIGGVLMPKNPFSTNEVCERCNNISGFFIDAPFTKSWIINNYRSSNSKKFATITPQTILPLSYMGIMKDVKYDDKLCENYLGPNGDVIYHFHKPYDEEFDTLNIVGLPPHLKNKSLDEGFVFIFIRSNNPVWLPTVLNSFISHFKKSIQYLGNGPTPNIPGTNFQDIPTELVNLHKELLSLQGKEHKVTVTMDIGLGDRFLAKLALGLGCIFLNETFKTSEDASLLRNFMWTKKKEERDKIPIQGSGFFNSEKMKEVDEFLKWEGGHTINLMKIEDSLILYANFYGQSGNVIKITNNKSHWKGKINESMLFIVMPEMQRFVGPINMAELLAHRGSDYKNSEILKLENEIANIPPNPPLG